MGKSHRRGRLSRLESPAPRIWRRGIYGFGSVEVTKALDWTDRGMDFADALHLAKAQSCGGFVSFDRRFAKAAKERCGVEVRVL